jgi:acyl carrier protein
MNPTAEQLKELIAEITGKEQSVIADSTRFKEDLVMDSISIADLLSSLEEDYDIIVDQEDAIKLTTFSELTKFVAKLDE